MRKATSRLNNAVALALLTEAPESRLRLPEAEQTPTERHVATLLRLLGLIGEVRHEDDDFTIAQALAVVDDAELARIVWQRLDYDDGIVQATVSGRNTAIRVMDAFVGAADRCGFRACNALSQRLGWIYTHVHGGGLGEHHAMFHAKDPALTNRVVAYAAKQPGWYLSGRW